MMSVLTVVLALAAAEPAAAVTTSGWQPTQELARAPARSLEGGPPKLAMAADGKAIAVWQRPGSDDVDVLTRDENGDWAPPRTVSPPRPFQTVDLIQLASPAINARGDVIVPWGESREHVWYVEAAARSEDGHWLAARTLSSPDRNSIPQQVILDGAGDGAVMWTPYQGGILDTLWSRRAANGEWTPPVHPFPPEVTTTSAPTALETDAAGDAAFMFGTLDGPSVNEAFRAPGGQWTTSRLFTAAERPYAQAPEARLYGNGDALAVIQERTGASYSAPAMLVGLSRPRGGQWGGQHTIATDVFDGFDFALDVAATGDAIVVWPSLDQAGDMVLRAATRDGGTWSAARDISLPDSTFLPMPPAVAIDGHGDAVVAWSSGAAGPWGIQAVTRTAGGEWSAPRTLSVPAPYPLGPPAAGIDEAGNAVVVWATDVQPLGSPDALRYGAMQAATYLSGSPRPALSPPPAITDGWFALGWSDTAFVPATVAAPAVPAADEPPGAASSPTPGPSPQPGGERVPPLTPPPPITSGSTIAPPSPPTAPRQPRSLVLSGALTRTAGERSRLVVVGRLFRGSGLSSNLGCHGTVVVEASRGGRPLVRRSVPLGHDCRFRARLPLALRPLIRHARVDLRARFLGNGFLKPESSHTISVRG